MMFFHSPGFSRMLHAATACFLVAGAPLATCIIADRAEAGWHHRYSGGSCGSCGHASCRCRHHGSHGSHGSSGGSSGGSHGGSAGNAPAKAATPAAPPKAADATPAAALRLVVELPADATLVINGQATRSVGDTRTFGGAGLEEDKKYAYELMVSIDGPDGREEHRRTVWLTAGTSETISFHEAFAETARKRAARLAANVDDTAAPPPAPVTDLTAR